MAGINAPGALRYSPFSAPVCERASAPRNRPGSRSTFHLQEAVSKRNTHLKLLFKSLGPFQERLIALGFVGEIYLPNGEWVTTILGSHYLLNFHDQPLAGLFDWYFSCRRDIVPGIIEDVDQFLATILAFRSSKL